MYRVPLGPFELEEPVGKGGMGEVWRGHHIKQKVAVAVKVLTRDGVRKQSYLDAFLNEIQAVAKLNHPGVVMVLEHGFITKEAERASHHRLVAGSPYFVMEYARHGSLFEYQNSLQWEELRAILFTILDALAHAHARGVIHRDLKPQNILLGCGQQEGVKLTDFGLAHALHDVDHSDRDDVGWGTPLYMAPEQFRGYWRTYGPWTDLYALGVMAFELSTGVLPFGGENSWELGRAHIMTPVPRLIPRFPVPEDFERWVLRLLQKGPGDRFICAADAALALASLGEIDETTEPRVLFTGRFGRISSSPPVWDDEAGDSNNHTMELRSVDLELPSLDWKGYESQDALRTEEVDLSPLPVRQPRPPSSWRQMQTQAHSARLVGAGLGLFGMRQAPFVGRHPERDRLWDLFLDVSEEKSPQVVLLHGQAGVGKSYLAQWFMQRVNELGAATVFKASFGPVKGPFDGLNNMFVRNLRLSNVDEEEAREHLTRHYLFRDEDAVQVDALLEFLLSHEELASSHGRHSRRGHDARFDVFARHLQRVAQFRPVVVWLDDVQWGAEGLFFVNHLLKRRADQNYPVLIMMTLRDEAIDDSPLASMMLSQLEDHKQFHPLPILPMADMEFNLLVQGLIGLEAKLAQQVEARAHGVPLFAVQLINDWIVHDKLEVDSHGFALAAGESADLPEDIHKLWQHRLDNAFGQSNHEQRLCIELAATLGLDVARQEWRMACEARGIEVEPSLLKLLINQGLVTLVEDGQGWSFAHGMMRESLVLSSQESGTWVEHNRACAKMLETLYLEDDQVHERLAQHLIEAQLLERAMTPLLAAAYQRFERSELAEAHELINQLESLLNRLLIAEKDDRRGIVWVMRSRLFDAQGKYLEALRWATSAITQATRFGWRSIFLDASLAKAYASLHRGATSEAKVLFDEVLQDRGSESEQILDALIGLARVAQRQGHLARAQQIFERAFSMTTDDGLMFYRATCLNGLGDVARQAGHYKTAGRYAELALTLAHRLHHTTLLADCYNDQAELFRYQGEYEQAARCCLRAISLYESVDSEQSHRAKMNYAFICLGQNVFDEATDLLRQLFDTFRQTHDHGQLALASVGVLPCLAHQKLWRKMPGAIEQAKRLLFKTQRRDHDIVFAASLALTLASEAHQLEIVDALHDLVRVYSPGVEV